MKFAAFFRNLNLGRPPAPSRSQLEQAFMAGGASSAQSFLTNGTLVFEARSATAALKVLRHARQSLKIELGFEEPAFMRSLSHLSELVAGQPFKAIDPATVYECCVTFFDESPDAKLPPANAKADVRILSCTATEAMSASLQVSKSPGSPNAFIERQTGRPASTRAWSTVKRLVEKFGDER